MDKKDIVKLLIKLCTDAFGDVDLSDLDFGNKRVALCNLKAYSIDNAEQEAETLIYNCNQKAYVIKNNHQKTKISIDNSEQKSEYIINERQQADDISNDEQKETLKE
jgi:hypothetical protein